MFELDATPLTHEEFEERMEAFALTGKNVDVTTWATTLASIIGVVSLNHEQMGKDDIVRALQEMAIVVPEELLDGSIAQLEEVYEAQAKADAAEG